jgi:hypothetical protein
MVVAQEASMRTFILRASAFWLLVNGTLACGDARDDIGRTDDHALSELTASYGAFDDGQKLEVFVAFIKDGFNQLGGGDTLRVEVNGGPVATRTRVGDGKVHYIAEVKPPPPEAEVRIIFSRGAEQVIASGRVGPAFSIVAPPASIRVGDPVETDIEPRPDLTKWSGPLGPTLNHRVEVYGQCIKDSSQKLGACAKDAPGCIQGYPFVWKTSELVLVDFVPPCDAEVQVRLESAPRPLEATGPLHQSFAGQSFEILQHRKYRTTLVK